MPTFNLRKECGEKVGRNTGRNTQIIRDWLCSLSLSITRYVKAIRREKITETGEETAGGSTDQPTDNKKAARK
jgi:hypothetical protein